MCNWLAAHLLRGNFGSWLLILLNSGYWLNSFRLLVLVFRRCFCLVGIAGIHIFSYRFNISSSGFGNSLGNSLSNSLSYSFGNSLRSSLGNNFRLDSLCLNWGSRRVVFTLVTIVEKVAH